MGLLYEAETKGISAYDLLAELPAPPDDLALSLTVGVADNIAELDEIIGEHARDWTVDRMPALDRALLRIAVYELVHRPDVPTGAAITEAVELARQFSTDSSGAFINGVLAAVTEQVR